MVKPLEDVYGIRTASCPTRPALASTPTLDFPHCFLWGKSTLLQSELSFELGPDCLVDPMSRKVSEQFIAEVNKYYEEDWHKPWLKLAEQQEQDSNDKPLSDYAEVQKKNEAELAAAMSSSYELPDGITLEGVLKDLAELKVKPNPTKAGPSTGKKATKK